MKGLVGTFLLGIFTALFGFVFWANWQKFGAGGTHFLRPGSGRFGLTTFDHLILLGALALVCGFFFLGSLWVLFSSAAGEEIKDQSEDETQSNAGPPWICAHCHEENPENFGECWKCRKIRPARETS